MKLKTWINGCCCLVTKACPTLAIAWTVVHQAPLSMEFSRQEYWSGLPFPSSGDLPDPGIEPLGLLYWQTDSLPLSHQGNPNKLRYVLCLWIRWFSNVRISLLSKLICSFCFFFICSFKSPNQNPSRFCFWEIDKQTLKFLYNANYQEQKPE